jgi:nucleolar pre-ribosomal-associated protein 1
LRNQLTIRASEPALAPQDERLLFAQRWLELDGGAQSVFDVWGRTTSVCGSPTFAACCEMLIHRTQRQNNVLTLAVSVLASLVSLLSSHYTYHALGQPVVHAVLSSQWTQQLNSYLSGTHLELVLATLKLYNAMSTFAAGRERKSVMDAFPWELKASPSTSLLDGEVLTQDLSRFQSFCSCVAKQSRLTHPIL